MTTRIRVVKRLEKAPAQFKVGQRTFGGDVIDGVKAPSEDEQAAIHHMQSMRQARAGYRDMADWMRAAQERKMTLWV